MHHSPAHRSSPRFEEDAEDFADRLAQSEARLQLALSAGRGIGTWDWHVPLDRVIADERCARLYGVDPVRARDGVPISDILSRVHPDDIARLRVRIESALRTGDLFSEEYRLVDADGHVSWLLAEGRCTLDATGGPLRFSGVSFDISGRKAVEKQLRELNAELEQKVIERTQARGRTWQVSPDLLGALNSQGYFETSNPAWFTVLGWTEDEVASQSIFELLHPDDVERTRAEFELTQQGQPAIRFPNRYRHKAGHYRWISWVGVPEDGLVYCSGRDITEEREQAEALARAEDALRQAQKMEAIGQLTGGLAHDFNNLLAGISGSFQVIEAKLAQGQHDGLERYLEMGQNSVRRAASLTQRLLAFSRRQTLDPRPIDVKRLVDGMEDLVRRSVGPSVSVEVAADAELWATCVDASQLENALLNLCINARDAMLPLGGQLKIVIANSSLSEPKAAEHELIPGDYVSICVIDTGAGMAPDVATRIFDPFYTTKPLGQGTGLGLSMVYGFARQSGGHITVSTEPGQGTTMCIYLPRDFGDIEDVADAPENALERGQGETILLIDDEDVVRIVLNEVLGEAGYEVLTAGDGASGLAVLQSTARIDLLITDVGLPGGLNGRQVADAGRALRPHLKVLFVTGFADGVTLGGGAMEPGMNVLTKPFDVGTFASKVRDILNEDSPLSG
ncbi:PAS domain-containing protein [Tahibacter sp.]|uniref:hybrid sensor histidine kinase/response regulator n=1 Tax=Tahibacter sp. TaxID=2056211 RepID=UPI0028C3E56A|nr:PAS domain-containing protein [Tahibacter sp.]